MDRKDFEIMAPVGSYESLSAAVKAGADAVYFGVEKLNMRARSSANFTMDDLARIVAYAKEHAVRTYLTVNTVLYDEEIAVMHSVMDRAKAEGVDAVIVADQAAIIYARSIGLEVHISTQLNISNFETLKFYSQWADVAVLARELTLEQVRCINERIREENLCGPSGKQVKIEMFAHGALCMAVSGKCYLSLHESGCSANRGSCRQLCRRSYILTDRETGDELATAGNYILSPKDLCTIGFLDRFVESGVRVLKIEGRARSAEYVKRVVECYNEAIGSVLDGTFSQDKVYRWTGRLAEVFNRGFWGGYYLGSPVAELSNRYGSAATRKKVYVGKVTNFYKKISVAEVLVEATVLGKGDDIIFLGETTGALEMNAAEIFVRERPADAARQGEYFSVKTPETVRRGDKVYKLMDASLVYDSQN